MGRSSSFRKAAKPKPRNMLYPPPPSRSLLQGLRALPLLSNRHNIIISDKLTTIQRPAKSTTTIATLVPINTNSTLFRIAAKKNLEFALNNSYTTGTSRNHDYAIKRFLRFANQCGVKADVALPCSAELLCMWIADGVGCTGVGTATANIAALSAWHRSRGLPFEVPLKMKTIKQSLKLHWPEVKQQKPVCPPITPRMIRLLVAAWAGGTSLQKCALAIALSAFIGQMQLGELLPVSTDDIPKDRLPSRGRWSICEEENTFSAIFLPWTKTTGKAGALVTLPFQSAPLNPTTAICHHLLASPLDDSALLCEYLQYGKKYTLDKELFMKLCNETWSENGFQRITGHSFRIGGTTSLLLAGVDVEIVKGMGRWSSDAFKCYWRKVDMLFAKHASDVSWVDFDI